MDRIDLNSGFCHLYHDDGTKVIRTGNVLVVITKSKGTWFTAAKSRIDVIEVTSTPDLFSETDHRNIRILSPKPPRSRLPSRWFRKCLLWF
ncbi:hypothetical protein Runsl_1206 [Runella slithyformis DSM 19594]|uniref:Uncharacterized protein n=1 Tax=Runella slithyformis (strain ATCC 29530 / DSM 19594 / LMG 11500 / NCIMB 11436 / LSU 4) TaxID=761193 RepID=A0A7U3ZI64_RUNSL|nr:hypothetical protein Runsl_1206 [Runella slithyformis DSM 19594]